VAEGSIVDKIVLALAAAKNIRRRQPDMPHAAATKLRVLIIQLMRAASRKWNDYPTSLAVVALGKRHLNDMVPVGAGRNHGDVSPHFLLLLPRSEVDALHKLKVVGVVGVKTRLIVSDALRRRKEREDAVSRVNPKMIIMISR
jgi:hypothetical protein